MDLQAFLVQMNGGKRIAAGSPALLAMHRLAREALTIAARMNAGYRTPEALAADFSELTAQPVRPEAVPDEIGE